ncbi:cytochrome P450 [Serendipita vermifera]|nr:cytochrome P450 [Serendipita vermifera]
MSGLLQSDLIRDHTGGVAAVVLASIVVGYYYMTRTRNHNLGASIRSFPGPKRTPLLGNALNFPRTAWSDTFNKWREDMGDIAYLEFPGLRMLVINSLEDVEELLIKRANVWSGRPHSYFIDDLMEWGWALLILQPGRALTEQRKIFHKVIGPHAIADFDHLIENEAQSLVEKLDGFSGDPTEHVMYSMGSVIIESAYGEKVFKEHGAELIKHNWESLSLMTWAYQQIWLPDLISLARFLPSWIPGIQFPEYRELGRRVFGYTRHVGLDLVQKEIEKGTADFSVISKYLNAPEVSTEHLRDAVAMMYMGGVEGTSSTILTFLGHMQIYPDVQAKIHREIDEKVGHGGTLTFSEISSLEYFRAAWKESIRFNHPIPSGDVYSNLLFDTGLIWVLEGVIHANTEDDVWKGRFIPKGTWLVPHMQFILRDPRVWGDDADMFKPERFLMEYNSKANELPDAGAMPFGLGRRHCPGRYMAERSSMIYLARLLQAYEIRTEAGNPVPTKVICDTNLVRFPKELKLQFVPRWKV